MISREELEKERDELIRHRLAGTRAVQFPDGSRVEYRTDAEMAAAIASIDRMLAAPSSTPTPGVIRFNTSKGY